MGPLVTVEWLAEHLHDQDLVVLDATLPPVGVSPPFDTHREYLARHIPGAIFFDIDRLSDQTSTLPHMLPRPKVFAHAMSMLGCTEKMTFVVYEQEGVFSAPRARWMLRTMGARAVYLLNGGLRAWIEAEQTTEAGAPERVPAEFHAVLDSSAVSDFNETQHAIARRTQILDARSEGRFRGSAAEPRAGLPAGHMPGATSLPFTELVDNGRMLGEDELRSLFAAKQVDLARPVITTCGSGVTAAVVALALEVAGASKVRLYDGSWTEYAQQPEAVIESGDSRTKS